MVADPLGPRPRVVVTLAAPEPAGGAASTLRARLYLDAVERAGGEPVGVSAGTSDSEMLAALATMDGLLLSGGADVHPAVYGHTVTGTRETEPERDALERHVYRAARERGLPVLGICRGLQAINAFEGGWLVQHLDGHAGPPYGEGPALRHPLRVAAGSRLGAILRPGGAADATADVIELLVNSYHHQGVVIDGLAGGLRAVAFADHGDDELVEAVEGADGSGWLFAVQCHPERTVSTPPEFERLFAALVRAAEDGRADEVITAIG